MHDLLLVWVGSESTLKDYMDHLNDNTHNIRLTSQWSTEQIHFLDVNIFRVDDTLQTKVFFKPTDRNSFLPMHSGHHPLWLRNVPKGQMMRVRRNCSSLEDYDQQAMILKNRFVEKGYKSQHLDWIMEEIRALPREHCLRNTNIVETNLDHEWSFISSFHSQFREVENIFHKHWHVLCLDRTLSSVLPAKPKFIYRKAPNFGDLIVKKVIDPPGRNTNFYNQNGFFACRKCKACRNVSRPMRKVEKYTSTSNDREFTIKQFITCNTSHVVYTLLCPCG